MNKKFIYGNWKANACKEPLDEYFRSINSSLNFDAVCAKIFVPNLYFHGALNACSGGKVEVGAQNVSCFGNGSYTGEVTAQMLYDAGCKSCIIGHSERRTLFLESDNDVFAKFVHLLRHEIEAVVCVGETLGQRQDGLHLSTVESQLQKILTSDEAENKPEKLIIAYEPVWAIGTGKVPTFAQINEVCSFVRGLCEKYLSSTRNILYGGSVNTQNSRSLLNECCIDGFLIGSACLTHASFTEIARAAQVKS